MIISIFRGYVFNYISVSYTHLDVYKRQHLKCYQEDIEDGPPHEQTVCETGTVSIDIRIPSSTFDRGNILDTASIEENSFTVQDSITF